ncbi:MAG: Fosmidomycin resistance protein, partial [uncultured Thermomicrobiales bacterium]
GARRRAFHGRYVFGHPARDVSAADRAVRSRSQDRRAGVARLQRIGVDLPAVLRVARRQIWNAPDRDRPGLDRCAVRVHRLRAQLSDPAGG